MTTYENSACPACGEISATIVAGGDALREEIESLWSFHTERLRAETPIERLTDRTVFSQHPPLQLVRCEACGTIYRNPREDAETIEDGYRDDVSSPELLASLHARQKVALRASARRLRALVGNGRVGIEVGSHAGAFLAAARDEGFEFEGVEINAGAAEFARTLGFRVTLGDLGHAPFTGRVDAIAIWNCFDQLAEPRAILRAVHKRLSLRGILAIRVPNGGFYARLREHLHGPLAPIARTLLAHNNLLGFPYRTGFTPSSLASLLRRAGFRVERTVGDTLVPMADRWTRTEAVFEERMIKALLRGVTTVARIATTESEAAAVAPWFEVYARRAPYALPIRARETPFGSRHHAPREHPTHLVAL